MEALFNSHKLLHTVEDGFEFEVRFGTFDNRLRFRPHISLSSYEILKSLSKGIDASIQNTLCVSHKSGLKVIQVFDKFSIPWRPGGSKRLSGNKTQYIKKTNKKTVDCPDMGYRVSLCKETQRAPPKDLKDLGSVEYIKIRQRLSFVIDTVRYDLSMFKEGGSYRDVENAKVSYEIELESTENTTKENMESAVQKVLDILYI
jgi:hypothetical protein